MNLQLDVWSIGAILLVGALAFWAFRMLKLRIEEQRYQERMADLEFEASLLSDTGNLMSAASQDYRFLQDKPHEFASPAGEVFSSPLTGTPLEQSVILGSSPEGHVPADEKAQELMAKLQFAGFIRGVEGYVEVSGNPKGAVILRLKDGKLALLVPHMESEAFLRHNSRRVDLIIMAATDGSAFVIRPLEHVLADSITL